MIGIRHAQAYLKRLLTLYDLKNYFVDAASYLLKLYIDHVSLDGCGQACPGMPKDAFGGQSCYAYIEGVHSVVACFQSSPK